MAGLTQQAGYRGRSTTPNHVVNTVGVIVGRHHLVALQAEFALPTVHLNASQHWVVHLPALSQGLHLTNQPGHIPYEVSHVG